VSAGGIATGKARDAKVTDNLIREECAADCGTR
jgi:hypothetical protein